jgi:hypothetical protein
MTKIIFVAIILSFALTIGGYYLEEWVCGPCKNCGLKCNDCKCSEEIVNENR